jgi:hypothetical protein
LSDACSAKTGAAKTWGLVLRWIARGILICIAAFWVWFSIADGLGDAQTLGLMGFLMMLPAAVVVLGVLYVVWRWELVGAYLLLAITLLGVFMFYENVRRMTLHGAGPRFLDGLLGLSIFVLPFLIPAVLLLVKCQLDRKARSAAEGIAASS